MKKINDIKDSKVLEEILNLKKTLLNLNFQKSSGQLENSSKILQVRRDIARIHTALSEQKRRLASA